uniref:Type IV secretion protein VirB4 n=1 Tax=Ochrobactrum sp. LM19 TaxID=1449781 RepID=A0A0D5A111_9HYPH|nr:VirB4 family type IV secretion/conjugal transfer ATPase [Ochrobactrum sp. LM19]AJW30000.1 type IV secretion protein VirB4 [Ochrobactrum sp. LM19]
MAVLQTIRDSVNTLRRSVEYASVLANQESLKEAVPYSTMADDQTIRTKDGMFLTVIKINGFCHQTADQGQIDQMAAIRNTLLKALNDSRFAVYSHIIRRRIEPHSGGTISQGFAQILEERYMASLRDKRMYVNDLYLTVIRRKFQGKVGVASSLFERLSGGGRASQAADRQACEELRRRVANIVKALAPYGADVLKCVLRDGTVYSETLEFLAQLLNGAKPVPMVLPRMPLDTALSSRRVSFGQRAFEIRGAVAADTRYGAVLSIREYPNYTTAGFLDGLLKVPGEFIVSQSFSIMDRTPALEEIGRVGRLIEKSDDRGTTVEDAIRFARDEISSQRSVLGEHHMTVTPLADTVKEMEACVEGVVQEIQRTGMIVVREDFNLQPAFWSQLPCNFRDIARRAMISSTNFCHMASFHNFASGRASGNHWGPAVTLLQSTSLTPYYFNFHRDKVGSFTINGMTGSGKTALMSFLIAQSLRIRPTPKCAFFDKDQGAEIFIRALGGRYEVLSPGVPSGFNPLQLAGTADDVSFLRNLLRFCVRPRGRATDLTAEQDRIIDDAVEQIFRVPLEERRFEEVRHLLRGGERASEDDLASRFEIWCTERGWLFNNPKDHWSDANGIIGFDMTKVLDDPDIRTAALGYIFHRIEGMLDGDPMMLFIDEGWKLLNDDKFSGFVNDKLKTIRKLNGIVGIGTQSARDFAKARDAHTILEQTPTNIFFPDLKADEESYLEFFRLSREEFRWIRETPKENRQFLIKHGLDSVVATLDLSSMPDMIKVLSGDINTVDECTDLRARLGDAPEAWLPEFCGWSGSTFGRPA